MDAIALVRRCSVPVGASLCASLFFFGVPALPAYAEPAATFGPATDFATGTNPRSVALGDVNGDGVLDIVTANYGGNNVSVLLGGGNGTFGAATDFATGTKPGAVALGDVNGDGALDIVTAHFDGNNVSVLLGSGSGTFGAATDFATGTKPVAVALGDVNGDGALDLVTVDYGIHTVSVLLGSGNGTFGAATNYALGQKPASITLSDVDANGTLDIATANYGTDDVSVLLNNGDGTFGSTTDFVTAPGPVGVASGDVNGDGKLDIVTSSLNSGAGVVSVLLNNGDGTFGNPANFATGTNPQFVALGDVNGDGKLDIVAANTGGQTASVLLGIGNGTFGVAAGFATGNGPTSVVLGDVNGDGKLDVVTGHLIAPASANVLLNTTAYSPRNVLNPVSGPVTGGTSVTISGTNFTGATAVKFGATSAATFHVNSNTQITAATPAGTPGEVGVTVSTPRVTVTTGGAFTYTANVSTANASPANASPANGGLSQSQSVSGIPKKLKDPGTTTVNRANARTAQGQALTAAVRGRMVNRLESRGDIGCMRVVKGPRRKVTITLTGQCAMRIRVTYTAPGTSEYLAYSHTVFYRSKRVS